MFQTEECDTPASFKVSKVYMGCCLMLERLFEPNVRDVSVDGVHRSVGAVVGTGDDTYTQIYCVEVVVVATDISADQQGWPTILRKEYFTTVEEGIKGEHCRRKQMRQRKSNK